MNVKCIRCKGRNFCGRVSCPIMIKISSQKIANTNFKKDFSGQTPNVFVGRSGYPNINVGFLGVLEYNKHDEPKTWSKEDYGINDVIGLRTELVNSTFKSNVRSFNDRMLEMGQEVSLSQKPVEVDISLSKKPEFKPTFNQDVAPHGANVALEKIELTSNIRVPRLIDKIVSDDDLRAVKGIGYLKKHGYDEYSLTKLLSVGNLGVKKDRKLVPTRWAITAVDDAMSKDIYNKLVDYNAINDYTAYFGGHLGNYYLILMFPDVFSYELFEFHVKGGGFVSDVEGYDGRRAYAYATAGGYYAARLSIVKKLEEDHKQAKIIALRFITDDYFAPLGVWVVREAVNKAMDSIPIKFSSRNLMLTYARKLAKKKFGYDLDKILSSSKLLKEHKEQKKLWEY